VWKRVLAWGCGVVALCVCMLGCSSPGDIEVACDDFYERQHAQREIEVQVGKSITIELCSNPSTGFSWGEAVISDPGVVAEVGHEYDAREGKKPPAPGTPGVEIWTLKSLQPGQSTISVEYGRPWEGGTKAEWTFVLTVVVK